MYTLLREYWWVVVVTLVMVAGQWVWQGAAAVLPLLGMAGLWAFALVRAQGKTTNILVITGYT